MASGTSVSYRVGLTFVFVILIVAQSLATERSLKSSHLAYSPWHAICLSEVLKLTVNVIYASFLLVRARGSNVLVADKHVLAQLLIRYILPALGYTAANALGLFAVDAAGATGALVAGQMRLPTTAAIWQVVMGKRMSMAHWTCIVGTVTCCISYELLRRLAPGSKANNHLWRLYVPTLLGSVASAIAGASNERLLKRFSSGKRAHSSIHNACLCANAALAALAMSHFAEPAPDVRWNALLEPPTALAVALHAAVGICVSVILKDLSLPHKAIAGTLAAPTSVAFGYVVFGKPFPDAPRAAALLGVAICSCTFHALPMPTDDRSAPRNAEDEKKLR